MYPSNPSVQNEPYPQRVASTTVMTLARHVRSAAGSWHSMARAQLSRMACRVQPLGIIAKKKSTSDFPIETLSKIEDFHGFPPPPLITRCILSVHLGLKILNMAHPRPNWFLLLESAFLLVEPKPPSTLRLLNLHFLMDRFMAKLGPRQKKASQSILTESFKFTVMLPSKYPRTVAL